MLEEITTIYKRSTNITDLIDMPFYIVYQLFIRAHEAIREENEKQKKEKQEENRKKNNLKSGKSNTAYVGRRNVSSSSSHSRALVATAQEGDLEDFFEEGVLN